MTTRLPGDMEREARQHTERGRGRTTGSRGLGLITVALLLSAVLFNPGWTRILDPKADHPLLRQIAYDLHRRGVDVVLDWNSKVKTRKRPVVAPLANYPTSLAPKRQPWMREFSRGALGAIVAIKTSENLDADAFAQRWHETPQNRRIFISFAREDRATAYKTKAALEAQGYVAFVYLERKGGRPSQSAAKVGEYFRTAGTHLVVDTPTARRKPGVVAEFLMLARYQHPPSEEGHAGGNGKQPRPKGPRVGPGSGGGKRKHVVEVYGRDTCSRTQQAINLFKGAGAQVQYYNIDLDPHAARVVVRNRRWLEGGDTLPFIRVDGKPIHATNAGVSQALAACK